MGHEIGYIVDYHIERFYGDGKIVQIYEGTIEVEELIIVRELLGRG